MVLLNINAIETPDTQEFQPLPDGWYSAVISESAIRTGKDSGKDYLNLEFTITDGDYTSRKVWMVYSLWHDNDDVVKWAQEKLGRLATALGWQGIQDHEELDGMQLDIRVGMGNNNKNDVKFYRASGNTPPAAPADSNGKQKPAWA